VDNRLISRAGARDPVIDVARGLAILLVVLGHNRAISLWSPHFVQAIFLFHVPLFFLLSGYVFRRERFDVVLAKLMRRLLLPCFAAALLVGIAKVVERGDSFEQTMLGIGWATGQTLPWSHLWFLPTLFLSLIVVQLAGYLFEERPLAWAGGAAVATALAVVMPQSGASVSHFEFTYPVGLPWGIDLLALCTLFVMLGQLMRYSPELWQAACKPAIGAVAAVLFLMCATIAEVDLNLRMFAPFIPALLAACTGCVLTLQLAAWLSRFNVPTRAFAFVGRHTLPIFLLHVSIQKALLQLNSGSQLIADQNLLMGAATAAVAVLVSVLVERWLLVRVGVLRYVFLAGKAS
jgi:fucose 4-O-acetylase-like acetyltransferase